PFSQTYDAGTAISITVPATATIAGQGYTFQQWSDGSTSLTQTGTIIANGTLSFNAIYQGPPPPTAAPTAVSITSDLTVAAVGQTVTFSGTLTRTDTGAT